MVVVADHVRGEAVAEDVPAALVPEVDVMRVTAVEAVHRHRELGLGAREEQVVVRAHQAVADALDPELAEHGTQQLEENPPVVVVREQRHVEDREPRHVVEPVRQQVAR